MNKPENKKAAIEIHENMKNITNYYKYLTQNGNYYIMYSSKQDIIITEAVIDEYPV